MLSMIEKDIREVCNIYPKLKFNAGTIKNIYYSCSGEIDIFDNKGEYWGSFEIYFEITKNYPFIFPVVFETSKKIPNEIDRHINTDGSCCLTVLQKSIIEARKGISMSKFIKNYIIPYLANQLYFEQNERWANGEYLHGKDGIIQFYKEETQLNSIGDIIHLLKNISTIKKLGRNDICFCGSKKKLKDCHLDNLQNILLLPANRIYDDILILNQNHN